MRTLFLAAFLLFLPVPLRAAARTSASPPSGSGSRAQSLPPSEDSAEDALERSPRHGEYVDVPLAAGEPALRTWVVYPERKDRAGVVLVIHEIYGLTDWIRSVADQLAREGLIAVAPDLISGLGPGSGGTDSVASRDDVVKLVRALTPEVVRGRLDAVRAHATRLPAANGKLATLGFCWGGARSFDYAAADPPPQAAVVFYGSSPDSATPVRIRAPVLGLYGGDDARVNATIEPARAVLGQLGRSDEATSSRGRGTGFCARSPCGKARTSRRPGGPGLGRSRSCADT